MKINIASVPVYVFQSFQSGFPDNGTIVHMCPSAGACAAIDNFPAKTSLLDSAPENSLWGDENGSLYGNNFRYENDPVTLLVVTKRTCLKR